MALNQNAGFPSHPIHFLFDSQHTALTPASGHHGFEGPILNGKLPTGSYFHYLHHRYFNCNYGEATLPLDRFFGTFRDTLFQKPSSKPAHLFTGIVLGSATSVPAANHPAENNCNRGQPDPAPDRLHG